MPRSFGKTLLTICSSRREFPTHAVPARKVDVGSDIVEHTKPERSGTRHRIP